MPRETPVSRNGRPAKTVTWRGETLTLKEWGARLGIAPQTLRKRLYMGWSLQQTMSGKKRSWNSYRLLGSQH